MFLFIVSHLISIYMIPWLSYIKQKIRYNFTMEWYSFLYSFRPGQVIAPKVVSIDDTIERIVRNHCSVSRFGDGEMLLIGGKGIRFQRASADLGARLNEVLQSQHVHHMVCISDVFAGFDQYNRRMSRFWRTHLYLYGYLWDQHLLSGREYYNTFITRPYMDFKSKDQCGRWFESLKRIWDDRDIVFIEGEKTRLGVGNDLFNNAHSIHRILCPPTSAFDRYNEILEQAMKQSKEVLFLIALGPTATVLAFDLFQAGYQAIDVGHVDIEYEWYRMKVKRKVKVPSKYVNEAFSGNNISDSGSDEYRKQILQTIK